MSHKYLLASFMFSHGYLFVNTLLKPTFFCGHTGLFKCFLLLKLLGYSVIIPLEYCFLKPSFPYPSWTIFPQDSQNSDIGSKANFIGQLLLILLGSFNIKKYQKIIWRTCRQRGSSTDKGTLSSEVSEPKYDFAYFINVTYSGKFL